MVKLLNCNKQLYIYKQVYKIFVYQVKSKIKIMGSTRKTMKPTESGTDLALNARAQVSL